MNKKNELKIAFKEAFPYTIPILTGFIFMGMAYGVLMFAKGYTVLWSVLMSSIAFCGSMQFVAITLLTIKFNPIQAFLMSIMVNARHLFYGISMLEKYKGLGKIRYFLIYTLCDETFSVSYNANIPKNINKKYFYFFVSLLNYLYWSFGTFLGGMLGNIIPFNTQGLEFVLTALFVVLFLEQWKNKENRFSAILGIIATMISLIVFGKNIFVILSMGLILSVLLIRRKNVFN